MKLLSLDSFLTPAIRPCSNISEMFYLAIDKLLIKKIYVKIRSSYDCNTSVQLIYAAFLPKR